MTKRNLECLSCAERFIVQMNCKTCVIDECTVRSTREDVEKLSKCLISYKCKHCR